MTYNVSSGTLNHTIPNHTKEKLSSYTKKTKINNLAANASNTRTEVVLIETLPQTYIQSDFSSNALHVLHDPRLQD